MNRRQVISVICFLVGLFVILEGISAAVRPEFDVYDFAESSNVLRRIEKDPENTVDIIFAGDSEAGYGFAPLIYWKEYGYSAENIGYPNEHLADTYAMLQTIFRKQSVKLLVLETDYFFNDPRVFANDDAVLEKAEELIPILHYHKVYKQLKPDNFGEGEGNKNTNKGYWVRRGVRPYTGSLDYTNEDSARGESITDDVKEYLDLILDLCKENGVEVLVTTTPGPSYWTKERYTLLTEYCKEKGLNYIDMNFYNEEAGIDWSTDTMDGGAHMNHSGCTKMNLWFGRYLQEHYDFEDHRGDPAYSEWQNSYELLKETYDGV